MLQIIDKQAVADSFSKAARHYDQFAQLQRDIGAILFNKLKVQSAQNIVDLGCGTGYFSEKISAQFPTASLTCFDLSSAMLNQAEKRNVKNAIFTQGDIDAIPFKHGSLDLIYSNLVMQWSNNLEGCLTQIKKSLKKEGRGYFSTLLDGTLYELTQAWKSVDTYPHTNSFLSLNKLQKVVESANFSTVKITTETRVLEYESVIEVMRALKGIGANHVHGHQASQTSGRQLLKQLQVGYQPFINERGRLNLTYQVCYIEVIK